MNYGICLLIFLILPIVTIFVQIKNFCYVVALISVNPL